MALDQRNISEVQAVFDRMSQESVSQDEWTAGVRAVGRYSRNSAVDLPDANRDDMVRMWLALKKTGGPNARLSGPLLNNYWAKLRMKVSVEKRVFALDRMRAGGCVRVCVCARVYVCV